MNKNLGKTLEDYMKEILILTQITSRPIHVKKELMVEIKMVCQEEENQERKYVLGQRRWNIVESHPI